MTNYVRIALLLFSGLFLNPVPGFTQQPLAAPTATRPFADLGRSLRPGDTVFVTERDRGESRGKIVRLLATSLVLDVDGSEREIPASNIAWIEKRGDPLWNGALIGAAGLGFGSLLGAGASCYPDCGAVVTTAAVIGAAEGAGIGALVDWLHRGRQLVYGTPPGSAVLRRSRSGADVAKGIRWASPVDSLGSLWTRVRPGDNLFVLTTSGTKTSGTFTRASEAALTLMVRGELREIPADAVQEVVRGRGGNHAKRGLFIGMPLGAFAGTSRCYSVESDYYRGRHDTGPSCGASVLAGAAIGASIGAAIGAITWSRTTVYRAQADSSSAHSHAAIHWPGALAAQVFPIVSPRSLGLMASLTF